MDNSRSINNPKSLMMVYPLIFYQRKVIVHYCSNSGKHHWLGFIWTFITKSYKQSNGRRWQQCFVVVPVQRQSRLLSTYHNYVIEHAQNKFSIVTVKTQPLIITLQNERCCSNATKITVWLPATDVSLSCSLLMKQECLPVSLSRLARWWRSEVWFALMSFVAPVQR